MDEHLSNACHSQLGELTDKGRQTTLELGSRLRHLYVDQLGYMPKLISTADMIYLRATPIPRALESVQQTFWGMYPLTARTASFPPPTIVTRTAADETLFPNDGNCRRFNQLSRAFAQRTADRWNDSDQMNYLNKLISKWMPESSPRVQVDSHPRLSGIMDTINSTFAHGPATRLPSEFYDEKARSVIDQIGVEEWFQGYKESQEYRTVGIGGLVGDIVERMGSVVEGAGLSISEIGGQDGHLGTGRGGERAVKFALSGCHDTTLAAMLSSLGAFENEKWPPYTSHIAVEMFRRKDGTEPNASTRIPKEADLTAPSPRQRTFVERMLGLNQSTDATSAGFKPGMRRTPTSELTNAQKRVLDGYFVRLRYNDRVMLVPGCRKPGNHLEGDESFCTLEAFKAIADQFTPRNWKRACGTNIDAPAIPERVQPAGYAEDPVPVDPVPIDPIHVVPNASAAN